MLPTRDLSDARAAEFMRWPPRSWPQRFSGSRQRDPNRTQRPTIPPGQRQAEVIPSEGDPPSVKAFRHDGHSGAADTDDGENEDRQVAVVRIVPDLKSRSLDKARAFYTQVLGLQVVMDHGWIVTLADPQRPEVQLSIMTHDATAPVIPTASIQVDDIDASLRAARAAGAEIVHELTEE